MRVHEVDGLLRRFVKREVVTAHGAVHDLNDLPVHGIRDDAIHPPAKLLRLVQDAFERYKLGGGLLPILHIFVVLRFGIIANLLLN